MLWDLYIDGVYVGKMQSYRVGEIANIEYFDKDTKRHRRIIAKRMYCTLDEKDRTIYKIVSSEIIEQGDIALTI